MRSTRALIVLPAALVAVAALPARAAPRVGVVVVSHEGMTEEHSDEIAYDLAAAVATQIEGEAIAGSSVRELLPEGVPDGCEEQPQCGRDLGAKLKSDEVLLLVMHAAGKTIVINCHRVPRDEEKAPSEQRLRLFGGKAKRASAVLDAVTALYPSGSVTAYVEPPPVVKPAPAPEQPEKPAVDLTARSEEKPASRKWLWVGIGAGVGVVAVLALVLGLALGIERAPTGPSISLP
jgi:hypothetical protein